MATRKIKDAKDLSTNELIYFKGHAKATYMSDGRNVEEAISQIGTGGGGGGIAAETDPIFSASPAASITEEKKAEWDSKMDKVTLAAVATSGSYNDLSNKPTIPSAVTESTVSGWGFTKNTGTYSKPSGGIPKTDLASAVQTSLGKADTALQSHQDISGKQDKLVSGTNIKTINGTSILGSGDITISGGEAVDNVYITDFKVEDLELLVSGHLESLQIDGQALTDALYEGKRISVPYTSDIIGGHAILLGEVSDTDIYFTVYTHQAKVFYCEAIEGVIYNWGIWGRDVTSTVEQTDLETLKNIAIANAVQTGSGNIYAFPGQANGDEDDVLLSRGMMKTINGQYLLADENSNDITVAYPEKRATSTTMILQPNTVTVWGGNVTGTIQLTFAPPLQGYVSEYIARFTVGSDGVQLIVPDNVVWADGVLPAMTPGKTYEISFVDNLATFLEF